MGTTVWVDDRTRAALRRLQQQFGTRSVNDTLQRLLGAPSLDAHAIFARHRTAIRAILRKHGLSDLVAFGSRARGDAGPASDLDLAARPKPGADPLALLAAEADLEEALSLKVNLVELPNPKLEAAIRREGIPFGR